MKESKEGKGEVKQGEEERAWMNPTDLSGKHCREN